jgi:hypothetical protein
MCPSPPSVWQPPPRRTTGMKEGPKKELDRNKYTA